MYCPYCGKPNEEESAFCEHCGKSLLSDYDDDLESDWDNLEDQDIATAQPEGGNKPGSKKPIVIAVVVIAILAVVILVAVFALGSDGGEGKAGTSGSASSATEEAQSNEEDDSQSEAPESAEHKVLFETSGGTTYEPMVAKTGDVVTSPEEPSKNNAEFEGWYSDQELTVPVTFPYTVDEADPETIIFFAKWSGQVGAGSSAGNVPPYFASSKASSQLPGDEKTSDYGPGMARDGDVTSAWNEGAPGDGVGEWLQLESPTKQHVSGLRIASGFQKNEEIWSQNRRPREVTISFEDGTTYRALLDDVFGQYQTITFDKPVDTRIVRITIDSTYQGKYFDDCCISEIQEF